MILIKMLLVLMMSYLLISLIRWRLWGALAAIKSFRSGSASERISSLASLTLSILLLIIMMGSIQPLFEIIIFAL